MLRTDKNPQSMMETRANEFDSLVGEIQYRKAIELSVGENILELGCGIGRFTSMLSGRFKKVVAIDCSEENIAIARRGIPKENVCFFVSKAENFQIDKKFDTILLIMLLEHVNNPIQILENARSLLNSNGRIIIEVPNANSFNRQLAKIMGIIQDLHYLPEEQIQKYGHKRVYDMNLLMKDIKTSGLKIIKTGGLVFKPFTNQQMQLIIREESKHWKEKFMRALLRMGERFPSECAVIYIVAAK